MNSVAYKRILKFFSCLLEKAAFERCFKRSIDAARTSVSTGHFGADSFEDTAQRYILSLDQCFSATSQQLPVPDVSSLIIDGKL